MPANDSEQYLFEVSRRSFLSLWSFSNPFWSAGDTHDLSRRKELCDVLVVFGDTLIVFSDKSSRYPTSPDEELNWRRWYRRSIHDSVRQLKQAKHRLRQAGSVLYETHRAADIFPLQLPPTDRMEIHLIAVARTAGEACERTFSRRSLAIDSGVIGDESYLTVGTVFDKDFVHVLDASTLDIILSHRDTAADFIAYLRSKERALSARRHIVEGEENLLARYLGTAIGPALYELRTDDGPPDLIIRVSDDEWKRYISSERYARSITENRISYNLDRLIDLFANDARERRRDSHEELPLSKDEEALRLIAQESRFGRRLMAGLLKSIWDEPITATTWAAFGRSKDFPDRCYLWLTYPDASGALLEAVERWVLHELTIAMLSALEVEPASLIIGLGVPNRESSRPTHFVRMIDVSVLTDEFEKARRFRDETGSFSRITSERKIHFD